jgi:hypothetical protein
MGQKIMNKNINIARPTGIQLGKVSEAARVSGWRSVLADDLKTIQQVRILQRTLRGSGIPANWENFALTFYWQEAKTILEPREQKKFQAFWEVLFECGDQDREHNRGALGYALGILVAHQMAKHGTARPEPGPEQFGVEPEKAGRIRDLVKSRYEDLTGDRGLK